MLEYEKDLESCISVLNEKLEDALEQQDRNKKFINGEIFDLKSQLAKISQSITKLKRMRESSYEGRCFNVALENDIKNIEKEITSAHDSMHDRVLNILDRFKE